MKKRSFSRLFPATLLFLATLFSASVAHADYLWIERDGAALKVRAGTLAKPLASLPALLDAKAAQAGGKNLPHSTANDHYAFSPADDVDARFSALRAEENGILTYFEARFGRRDTQPASDLELVPTTPGGNTFRLFFKGQPVAANRVNVETSESWRRALTSAPDGTVSFMPSFPGLYVLEVSAQVNNGNVTLDGKTYKDVRYTATLSFEIPAATAGGGAHGEK
ncbi:MAG: DUF4198 domain-containing protein [Azoarcus sp.]|jgi:hypothetical protein|nr:DUF4198 domain-containing protein [Azoarcus sp.]